MKNICKKLPSSISNECDNLINTYGDAIFFLLSQELDPNILCAQLQLCTESAEEEIKLPANPFKGKILKIKVLFQNTETIFHYSSYIRRCQHLLSV